MSEPLVFQLSDVRRDGWDDPVKGRIGWRTLFGGDGAATEALTAGVAEVEPGGWLGLHRHAPPEIYFGLEGQGIVTLDGAERVLRPGTAVFIPGDCEHGVRNPGPQLLRFLYAFAVDSFAGVEYRFSEGRGALEERE